MFLRKKKHADAQIREHIFLRTILCYESGLVAPLELSKSKQAASSCSRKKLRRSRRPLHSSQSNQHGNHSRTAGPSGCLMQPLCPVPNRRLLMLAAPVELALPAAGALSAPSRPQRMPNAALALRAQLGHAQLPPRAQAAHAQLVPGAAGGPCPAGASGGPCQAWRADKGRPLETPRARFTCWKPASGN